MKTHTKGFFVFDVESIGLHGEGFAVGYVVVNRDGIVVDQGCFSCSPFLAKGTEHDREWVRKNLPVIGVTHNTPKDVREAFMTVWESWRPTMEMVADCAWPVEARFLAACIDDNPERYSFTGPYPLHDLASVLLAKGKNPLETFDRMANELPAHHPFCDALQSARILIENLKD